MTTSTIVYFGSLADSKKGLQRTLVAFFVLWAIMFFLYKSKAQNTSIVKLAIASFAIALVLVSALGVQLPKSLKEAALYGALVGFVVSVSHCVDDVRAVRHELAIRVDYRWRHDRALFYHGFLELQVFFQDQNIV